MADGHSKPRFGVSFRRLSCYGFVTREQYQTTFASSALAMCRSVTGVFRKPKPQRVQILGCSTFLKTLSGFTRGFCLDNDAEISYQGNVLKSNCIYMSELDVHFSELTSNTGIHAASMFRLEGAYETKVGNAIIRGISGGEKRRTSIAEAFVARAQFQCWDNSTRGLDSFTARRVIDLLRASTSSNQSTVAVSLYQASEGMYKSFDKVMLLYEGRQIYFGPIESAASYMISLERASTADFLTSMTNPSEYLVAHGYSSRVPRTSDDFARAWEQSKEAVTLLADIEEFTSANHTKDTDDALRLPAGWYLHPQVISTDPQKSGGTISAVVANSILGLVVGSAFYNTGETTDDLPNPSILLYFALIMNAFAPALEVTLMWAQRPIVDKQSRYSFYHPFTERLASLISDMPSKVLVRFGMHIPLYFLSNLRRTTSAFFTYWLFMVINLITMSMFFRMIGSISKTREQTLVPVLKGPKSTIDFCSASQFSRAQDTMWEDQSNDVSGPETPISSLRTTQRAPRSCRSCALRKIKCDKAVPCSTCIRRGEADICIRETVIVRGRVTKAKDPGGQQPSYGELAEENARLRAALGGGPGAVAQTRDAPPPPGRRAQPVFEEYNEYERLLLGSFGSPKPTPSMNLESIILPSRACSHGLVAYDKEWNSWVHYAVEYPEFEQQHDQFMDHLQAGGSLADMDPFWLAIYFSASLLTMDNDEIEALGLPSAELACAMSIARTIGLDRGDPVDGTRLAGMSKEARRRLWWTLVICEWLPGPHPPSVITEMDFDVPLPAVEASGSVIGPGGLEMHPVQYHIFMARTSTVYNRFRMGLRGSQVPLDEAVRRADEELAEIINTLPQHLSPEGTDRDHESELEALYPWIRWQRVDVTLVLLCHRLRINRVLQSEWQADYSQYGWARSICLRAAKDLIWISQNWEQSAAKRSQWALAWHVYVAAIFIYSESQQGSQGDQLGWRLDIGRCIHILDNVRARNEVAAKASDVLKNLLGTESPH
ncbi:hypothetical protein LA080_015917 [Diaporthe eres]|nr:hypothetical protein LA080_015917 [Diaporthe eres]